MWAAAVSLEYSFSPALADIASASSENARAASWSPCRWWVRLSRLRQAIQAAGNWPPGIVQQPPGVRPDPPCRMAEPEQGGTEPGVGDTVPGRRLVCTAKCGLACRSAGSEVAEQPGVHGTEAVRRGGAGAEPVVERATGGCAGRLVDPPPDFIQPAGGDGHHGAGHTQPGVAVVDGGRQQFQPGSDGFVLTRGGEPEATRRR